MAKKLAFDRLLFATVLLAVVFGLVMAVFVAYTHLERLLPSNY